MEKEVLTRSVKGWLKLDQELRVLQSEMKKRKAEKKRLTETLVTVMKKNDIDCLNLSEGKMMYTQTRAKAPVNKAHLMACLTKYLVKHPGVSADEVVQYILDSRAVTTTETVRHKALKVD